MTKPLYIFDLDGTLADNKHREHILKSDAPDRWDRFFLACGDDQPVMPVVLTYWALLKAGCECWVWSGRGAIAEEITRLWLDGKFSTGIHDSVELRMRPVGDYTPDDELKRRWLNSLSTADRDRLVAVFDDRDKVVAMWRSEGVPCFQVAPGAF